MQLPRATRLVVRIAGPKSRAANARGGSPVRLPCRCPRLDSGEIYQRAIKRSRLVVMENCGQMPEMGEAGGVREAGRGFLGRLTLESRLTGLRRAFHRPEQSSEFMRHWGNEWTSEEADLVEQHREMTCRITWKPYMHSLTLRHLLPGIRTPTLLVWGREDAITPIDSGEIYQRAIPRSRLVVIENCGHMPEMEKPAEFARLVADFLAG